MAHEEVHNEQNILFDCSNEIQKYKCRTCLNFQTNFLATLKDHIGDGRRNKSPDDDAYTCLKRSFMTHSKYIVLRHSFFDERTTTRNENNRLKVEAEVLFPERFGRSLTKLKAKSSRKSSQPPRHSNPTNINLFHCDQCSYESAKKSHLKEHVLFRHVKPEDIQWFKCEQCSAKFKTKQILQRHVMSRHTRLEDIRWHDCPHCSYKCKLNGNLTQHIKLQHSKPEDIQWHECPHCPYKSKQSAHLKKHKKLLHCKPEDIHWLKCPHCSYKSKRSGDLKKHNKLHH